MGQLLVGFVIRWLLSALVLWAAIKLMDRGNSKNTFKVALLWCLAFEALGLLPLIGLVIGLIMFFIVCFHYYDLGVFQSIGVLVLLFVASFGVLFMLAAVFGMGMT